MDNCYLAIDIGASSGCHILGMLVDGRMETLEIHRFENESVTKDGEKVWDSERLFDEIIAGMKKCHQLGKIPGSVGIDTWGVDFVLLDAQGELLGNVVSYRDLRTRGMDELVESLISKEELYRRTGINKAIYNTIYQLMAVANKKPKLLDDTAQFLMLPDYLHFRLTGGLKKKNQITDEHAADMTISTEYTIASTTGLIAAEENDWDRELIELLGLPIGIFPEIKPPGTSLGELTPAITAAVGYKANVVRPASHDTASAVLAIPAFSLSPDVSRKLSQETAEMKAEHLAKKQHHGESSDIMYVSSGTWSLMGVLRTKPLCSAAAMAGNFSNEGGYGGQIRFLKNIMGLWMIQSLRKELAVNGEKYTYDQLAEMAKAEAITTIIDVNDDDFLTPPSMITAVRDACRKMGREIPLTAGQLAAVIYRSLADCYAETAAELKQLTGYQYQRLYIVGGGSKDDYLNQLTANATGMTVLAGVSEATAVGNLLAQMYFAGEWKTLEQARQCVKESFTVAEYQPLGMA
ncbi:MAG: rhamnulokinase [Lachnospiraceae bacterium]|nr:rhamnulokinase [Lachnospiraceae bacterium]